MKFHSGRGLKIDSLGWEVLTSLWLLYFHDPTLTDEAKKLQLIPTDLGQFVVVQGVMKLLTGENAHRLLPKVIHHLLALAQ